jgi:hypothetical protein
MLSCWRKCALSLKCFHMLAFFALFCCSRENAIDGLIAVIRRLRDDLALEILTNTAPHCGLDSALANARFYMRDVICLARSFSLTIEIVSLVCSRQPHRHVFPIFAITYVASACVALRRGRFSCAFCKARAFQELIKSYFVVAWCLSNNEKICWESRFDRVTIMLQL